MSILLNKDTRIIVQGITGKEGSRQTKEMIEYGANVVGGVVPGKAGEVVENVTVFNTVKEALSEVGEVDVSHIVVPGPFVLSAAFEAMDAGIRFLTIFTEGVKTQDSARIIAYARKHNVRVIGPSCIGIMVPKVTKLGAIGSGESKKAFTKGPIGIISKSGGMTAELSNILTREGIGQSTVIGIGGDQIIGSDFVDIMKLFDKDEETKGVVILGEVGGTYEEQLADYVAERQCGKPIVALIAGKFAETLGEGTTLGHAGAIVEKGRGRYTSKIESLRSSGVHIAGTLNEVKELVIILTKNA